MTLVLFLSDAESRTTRGPNYLQRKKAVNSLDVNLNGTQYPSAGYGGDNARSRVTISTELWWLGFVYPDSAVNFIRTQPEQIHWDT